jgi:HEAT repeat protein
MRHVATHLDTSVRSVIHAAHRFCMALGTVAIGPLAEVLSREERSRPRKHLIDILTGFGAPGRQSVEQLRQSPSAAVRRMAVMLLREFGGHEALPELESLLDDAEPNVQREAARAIAMLGIEAAYDALIRALERGTDRVRTSILGVIWTLPDEDAEQVLAHVVLEARRRGAMWAIHERAIDRLGSLGGRHSVNVLSAVLLRRQFWSPFRMAALHRLALDALSKIGTPEAMAVIETAASHGTRASRAAARARLGAAVGTATHVGRQR